MKASLKSQRPPSAAFHAVTHVWGRTYLDTFLNLCIPNQLAPGNVAALPPGSRYRIQTRSIHLDELESHPGVKALRNVIPVDIVVVDALDERMGVTRDHGLMIKCHQEAVADALAADAAIIFLSADFILSENALAVVVRRHRDGYRAVVNTGLRLAKESFLQHLHEAQTPLATLSSRQLVRIALPHLHPHTRSMFVDARPFCKFPVAVYWRVGDEGLLARCLHLHPLMVDPVIPLLPRGSNDGHYLCEVCPDVSRVHVVTDSDELQMFELTSVESPVLGCRGAGVSVWRAAAVAAMCDRLQVRYWRDFRIRIHTGECDDRWAALADASDALAARVLRLRPYGRRARDWFLFFARCRKRLERGRRKLRRGWRRRIPRVRLKQVRRPLRLATKRSRKTLRNRTRHILYHVGLK